MARFIISQTLTLLEKPNELDTDKQAVICESPQCYKKGLYPCLFAPSVADGERN
ncbi:Rop family plasmid primer RNA-binding protein [Salmonella enterica]|uniref:Rop family plasmid primer RNA-binding protein n=1 Tax=Salmonella enterica TaxID=28901 RepID=UPI003C6FAA0B